MSDLLRRIPQLSFVRKESSSIFNSATNAKATGGRKIFVVEQVMRKRQAKVRRILIFDNHAESLRLVFEQLRGGVVNNHISESAMWRKVVGASFLVAAAILGMFWPLL